MRRKARRGGGKQIDVEIQSLGGRGDGVAEHEGRPVFVPLTLPGDRVQLKLVGERAGGFKGEILELQAEGPGRVDPPCPHYGPCGGCTVQHAGEDFYVPWKRDLVVQSLTRKGFSGGEVGDLVRVGAHTRRRAVFAAQARGKKVVFGFHERESHRLVDLKTCLLLVPELEKLIAPLRSLLTQVLLPTSAKGQGKKGGKGDDATADITVTASEAGSDILVVSEVVLDLRGREAITDFAEAHGVARFAWGFPGEEPEPVAIRDYPYQHFGGIPVLPPEGGFLQPSAEGQQALTDLVLSYLPDELETVADLFCGCGTFTFPLSQRARVHAIEGDERALRALTTAARRNETANRVTADCRDLSKDPVTADELEGGDCVVLDPPRNGAREQCLELADSDIPVVIYVSCNPNTFARDARTLVEGGYSLEEVTPVDQFIWSGHVELVARFVRDDDWGELDGEEAEEGGQ